MVQTQNPACAGRCVTTEYSMGGGGGDSTPPSVVLGEGLGVHRGIDETLECARPDGRSAGHLVSILVSPRPKGFRPSSSVRRVRA